MKIAIITHGFKARGQHCYLSVCSAFNNIFDVTWIIVDYGWPVKIEDILNYKEQEAVIFFVGFKHLRRKAPFDWGDFTGKRIMYDFDACQNYGCGIGTSPYLGKWPEVFRRQKFDLLFCTGKKTTDSLNEEGINTYWLPKAFDGRLFYNKEKKRMKEIGHYGNMYLERKAMKDFLIKQHIDLQRINCFYCSLNDALNEYKICVVYNGVEPMIKQFEIAASGCVPFCNEIPELFDLGFVDGKTMVQYKTFEELVEKLKFYLEQPEVLVSIGRKAAKLAQEKHTWIHRMKDIERVINETS